MEELTASVHYGDLKGGSGADWSDDNGHDKLLKLAGVSGLLVGISINKVRTGTKICIHVVKAGEQGGMMALVKDGTLEVARVETELTMDDLFGCMKLFSVALKHRKLQEVRLKYPC